MLATPDHVDGARELCFASSIEADRATWLELLARAGCPSPSDAAALQEEARLVPAAPAADALGRAGKSHSLLSLCSLGVAAGLAASAVRAVWRHPGPADGLAFGLPLWLALWVHARALLRSGEAWRDSCASCASVRARATVRAWR